MNFRDSMLPGLTSNIVIPPTRERLMHSEAREDCTWWPLFEANSIPDLLHHYQMFRDELVSMQECAHSESWQRYTDSFNQQTKVASHSSGYEEGTHYFPSSHSRYICLTVYYSGTVYYSYASAVNFSPWHSWNYYWVPRWWYLCALYLVKTSTAVSFLLLCWLRLTVVELFPQIRVEYSPAAFLKNCLSPLLWGMLFLCSLSIAIRQCVHGFAFRDNRVTGETSELLSLTERELYVLCISPLTLPRSPDSFDCQSSKQEHILS